MKKDKCLRDLGKVIKSKNKKKTKKEKKPITYGTLPVRLHVPLYNEKTKIYGIDFSMHSTGWASFDMKNQEYDFGYIHPDKLLSLNYCQRLNNLRELYQKRFKDSRCVLIEDYSLGSISSSHLNIAETRGQLINVLYKNNTEMYLASPKTIKSIVAGNGNAKKEQVMAAIKRKFNFTPPDIKEKLDISDAYAMLKILMNILKLETTLAFDIKRMKKLY